MSSGNGKKRKTSSSTSATDEYLRMMSEEEKTKYLELRRLFETWAGVTPRMSNIERMTKMIDKINQSMRLNLWYAKDGLEKSNIIENRDNYCNFCWPPDGESPLNEEPKMIKALNEWRGRRLPQPMIGGGRKTRRNKIKKRRKTKRRKRKKRSRKKKGGVYTEKSDDESKYYHKFLKLYKNRAPMVVGEGVFESFTNRQSDGKRIITLDTTPDAMMQTFEHYLLEDFDNIVIVPSGMGGVA